jgi:hypothetical protein
MMAGQPQELPPGELARLDQIAAELSGLVRAAAAHADICTVVPAGACIGLAATTAIHDLSCSRRVQLLEEAVAQLAHALAPETRTQP